MLVEELLNIGGHLHRFVLVRLEFEGVEDGLQIVPIFSLRVVHI